MLSREYRLTKNRQFQAVYRRGRSQVTPLLVVLTLPSRAGIKVGFSVSKKIGGSVQRNLVRRRLRACFARFLPDLRRGQYVVVARDAARRATFLQLLSAMQQALTRGGFLKPKDEKSS